MGQRLTELMIEVAQLHAATGDPPANQYPGLWRHPLVLDGQDCTLWVNGHPDHVQLPDGKGKVPPYHAMVTVGGTRLLPLALWGPYDGVILGGDRDLEVRLLDALRRAQVAELARRGGQTKPDTQPKEDRIDG